ncbi:MAG: hypothetical protein ACXVCP_18360 [Bdellovibrio sp.]
MKTYMHRLVVTFFLLLLVSAFTAQAKTLCQPSKNSNLAIDQRDEYRMKCLKQNKASLKTGQCLAIARSMEYSTMAEDAKLYCLYNLQPSLNECVDIANSMEYPDSGDEARWECIKHFSDIISVKQCKKLAKSMSYPANSQRAALFCSDELH